MLNQNKIFTFISVEVTAKEKCQPVYLSAPPLTSFRFIKHLGGREQELYED